MNFVTKKNPCQAFEYIQFSTKADHNSVRKYILDRTACINEIKTLHTDESVLAFLNGL